MGTFENLQNHREIVRYLRGVLQVYFVFSNEIIGNELHIRASDCGTTSFESAKPYIVPLDLTICKLTLQLGVPLVIDDAHSHPLVRNSPALEALGVAAYLGTPIPTPPDKPQRSLCALHVHSRAWLKPEIDMMKEAADYCSGLPLGSR